MFYEFAVIGNPVAHSLSPVIHQQFALQTGIPLNYGRIKGEEYSFEQQVLHFFNEGGKGLNVTLPFKQRAFDLANHCTSRCQHAGAANTLWRHEQQIQADNTDGVGFIRDVHRYIKIEGKRILLLGAGGAARGIIHPLLEHHPLSLNAANRTIEKAKELQVLFPQIQVMGLDELNQSFDLIINATSAGLSGTFIELPESCMANKPFCYDLFYTSQGTTPFVHYARSLHSEAVDGLGMLVEQAAEAFFIWHGRRPETQEVIDFIQKKREPL